MVDCRLIFLREDDMSEYWIQDADLVFADGDAGVDIRNHEMHVVAHYWQILASELSVADCVESQAIGRILTEFYDDDCIDHIAARCAILDAFQDCDCPFDAYVKPFVQASEDEQRIAFYEYDLDPRLYAAEHLGWIRVVGDHLELHGLTPRKMQRAAYALSEIDDDHSRIWFVEDRKTRNHYEITLLQMESKTTPTPVSCSPV